METLLGIQAANLAGFRASKDRRFEAGIPDFMNGILNFSIHFNVVHRKVDWRNPKMKSLNSMPGIPIQKIMFTYTCLINNLWNIFCCKCSVNCIPRPSPRFFSICVKLTITDLS